MEELQEAQDKCEYPPRLQIRCIRNDPSVNLQYNFHVEKMKKKKTKCVAEFQLLKTAKGNIQVYMCLYAHTCTYNFNIKCLCKP